MVHEIRSYRELMQGSRFVSFNAVHKETDLWIGIDKASFRPEMKIIADQQIRFYRKQLEDYISINPQFNSSFAPILPDISAPSIAILMMEASRKANVGPMASVAGAFAELVSNDLKKNFSINEIIVENGGDVFITTSQLTQIAVFAGSSPLSNKIGIEVPANDTPLGICTSSATVGPSISFGKTDATMIVCKSAVDADAYASYFGNMVKLPDDINVALEKSRKHPDILSILIVFGDQMGIRGMYPMKVFN